MKERVMILSLVVTLVLAGCSVGQTPAQGGEAAAGTQAPVAQENVIWASGKLLPARWAALSPATADEMARNAWLSVDADERVLFATPIEQRWSAAATGRGHSG